METEAYRGRFDPAAHSYKGRTDRVRALYEGKGLAYIYLIYGIHCCLNFSCGPEGEPECVLIRALEPSAGIDVMCRRRGTDRLLNLCSGPGKLCAALGVDRSLYAARLWDPESPLRVEYGGTRPEADASRRVGIDYAGPARDYLWRFTLRGSKFVSKSPGSH